MKSPLLLAATIVGTALFAGTSVAPAAPKASAFRTPDPALGHQIAQQGNRALLQIRADLRNSVSRMAPPALPAYASTE